jgi:hypothetical protein
LADQAPGETIVIDILTALLGITSLCVMFRAVTKVILRLPKVREEDWIYEEIEELSDYNEIRKQNPHIWIQ